jgi:altered-inheritance-of-mitochondria protein 13
LEELEKRSAGLKKQREETSEWKSVDIGKEALIKCFRFVLFPCPCRLFFIRTNHCIYRDNKTTPLNCREQAEKFKEAVAGVEKVRLFFLPLSFFLISLSRLAHSHSHSPQAFFASAAVN